MARTKRHPKSIEVPTWYVPGGGMMYKRYSLEPEHPGSIYNYIKNELGLNPERYGYYLEPEIKCTCDCRECKEVRETYNRERYGL